MAAKKQDARRRKNEQSTTGTLREGVRAFKRELILNVAIDTFFSDGYQNVSVDDIARVMSVSKAVVYYNFKTKEDILSAIIDRTTTLSRDAIDRGIEAGHSPAEKLALACYSYADHMMRNQKMVGVYFREDRCFPAALRTRTTKVEKTIAAKLSKIIEAGVTSEEFRPCDTRVSAVMIMGMISMAYYWYRETGRLSRQLLCCQFAERALLQLGYRGPMALDEVAARLIPR